MLDCVWKNSLAIAAMTTSIWLGMSPAIRAQSTAGSTAPNTSQGIVDELTPQDKTSTPSEVNGINGVVQNPEDVDPPRSGLDIPPINIPSNPLDITTPPAPPVLDIPKETQPIEPLPARLLELPSDPLEVRVEKVMGLSLEEVMDIAIERNPEVEQAREDVIIARRRQRAVVGEYLPQITTNTRFTYTKIPRPGGGGGGFEGLNEFLRSVGIDDPVTAGVTNEPQSQMSGTLRLTLTLYDGDRRGRRLFREKEINAAIFQLESVEEDVRLRAAVAYYGLQRADTRVLVAEAGLADSEASLSDAEALLDVGLGTRFDVLQARTRVANNRSELLRQQDVREDARFELASILNFDRTIAIASTDPIEPRGEWPLTLEDTIVTAFEKRPEFDNLRQRIAARRNLAGGFRAETRPKFEIFTSYDYTDDFDDRFTITDGYTFGGNFNWTIFDGGTNRANAQAEEATARRFVAEFEQRRSDIRLEVESAFYSLDNSRERIEVGKLALEDAQEQLRLARLRFQAGLGTQTDVIQAEDELTDARGGLAEAITDYNISLARLQRSVNSL